MLYSVILSADRRVTSAELLALAAMLELGRPRTVLSTGNLVFDSDAGEAELEDRLERTIAGQLGRPIPVFLRRADEVRDLMAANPFPEETRIDPAYVAVRIMRTEPAADVVARIAARASAGERFAASGRSLWVAVPGKLSGSALTRAVAAPWAGAGTFRSASALAKIAGAL
jgi:uncharacterized protein (DUF1697 family)